MTGEEINISRLIDEIIQVLCRIEDPQRLKNIYFLLRHIV